MPAWFVIPLIQAGLMAAEKWAQSRANKKAAQWSNEMNVANNDVAYNRQQELLKFQLDYNSPTAQMDRFKQAGLNPNLVYGQGSPGNMQSAPEPPKPAPVNRQPIDMSQVSALAMQVQQMKMMQAQTDLTEAKTDESTVKQDLIRAQTAVAEANPYLSAGYVQSLVSQMESTARMKKQEADWKLSETQQYVNGQHMGTGPAKGVVAMEQQLALLEQKFNLGEKDLKVKAQIIQSKDFQNALQQIQVEWMKNAEITPQHIYQGIMLFLQMLMRK